CARHTPPYSGYSSFDYW
nr:immunoglobulin heavy chain junction region [Macaca mulatta]